MNTETLLRQAVKGALAFGAAGTMVGAGAALAQTAAPAAGTTGTQLSKIVVTGSHIAQTSVATSQATITINRQQIDNTGFTTVGQLLQGLTSVGTSLNVQYNNGGNGMQYINLHDLGAQRVLLLVDGQRWVSGINGAVDLTTIPLAIVDRVEVLLNGASAVYGSEAIAGVINIITKKNFNGAAASAYMGMYNASNDGGGWDGKTQNYSFTVGTSGDRSSVLLSAGYYEQNAIWAGQRTISKEPVFGTGNSFGSASIPDGRYALGTVGQVPTMPGCAPTSYPGLVGYCSVAGPLSGPNANPHPFTSADRYNYQPAGYLRTPSERWYLYSQGHYDLTDNVSFSFLAAYNDRTAVTQLAANPWVLGAGGYTANGMPIGVSSNAPGNPFGVDLVPGYAGTPQGAAWCSKYGTGAGGGCTANYDVLFSIGWRPINAGNRVFSFEDATYYMRGGFNGYWMMAGNQWSWNITSIYAKTTETLITTGLANTANIQKALGPINTCLGASDGCVPLNMFAGQAGQPKGSQMLKYLLFTAHAVNHAVTHDYNANISGSFWNGWYAGPWSAAAGYEYYAQNGDYSPDAIISAGNTVGNARKPTSGRINTNAEYAELNIPFASNLPAAKSLSLDLAHRWSQFHWEGTGNIVNPTTGAVTTGPAGGRSHAATGRATLKWQPINQLLLRASWSAGFRAPSISELFFGVSDSYATLSDPCAPTTSNGVAGKGFGQWTPGTLLPAGCPGATGDIATQQHDKQPNAQILAAVGGNTDLSPEKSISRSVGFVYSPSWAPGLDFSADYFKVELTNNITSLGGQHFLKGCYVDQKADACRNITTTPNGLQVIAVQNLNTNGGSSKREGWDLDLKYRLPTTVAGNFTFEATATLMKSDVNCSLGYCTEYAGSALPNFYVQPKARYNVGLSWDYGPWAAVWNVRIIGPVYEPCALGSGTGNWCSKPNAVIGYLPGNPGQNQLGTTIYHDVQASYTVASWNTTFTLGVNNLFDKSPPVSHVSFANNYMPYYRTPGQFFYGRIGVRF